MNRLAWIAVVALVATAAWIASAADKPAGTSGSPPPLKVDRSAPLLLDDAPARPTEPIDPKHPRADNSACLVCHGNFQDESMVAAHAKENIGCAKCHGSSLAHRNDEDNVTAPDKMYASARIDKACRECHEEHTASPRKVIAMFQARFPANADPKKVSCTDCHGEHRLKNRSVRWDKETGKLLSRDLSAAEKSGVGWKKPADQKR